LLSSPGPPGEHRLKILFKVAGTGQPISHFKNTIARMSKKILAILGQQVYLQFIKSRIPAGASTTAGIL